MHIRTFNLILLLLSGVVLVGASGCAEGMLWRTGYLSPWVRQTWEDEERVAQTSFSRKRQMTEAVDAVVDGPATQKNRVAKELQDVVFRNPIVLLRLHAVSLLGELDCETSVEALRSASKDQNNEIRIAAVKALGNLSGNVAIPILQEVVGSDTNGDVRLAATQSLGQFSDGQVLNALAMAIEDRDPALQVAAIESLEKVTGEKFGADVFAWKNYLGNQGLGSRASVADRNVQPSSQDMLRR